MKQLSAIKIDQCYINIEHFPIIQTDVRYLTSFGIVIKTRERTESYTYTYNIRRDRTAV